MSGARKSSHSNSKLSTLVEVATRTQEREREDSKPLNVQDAACEMTVSRKGLMRWQEDDPSLRKFQDVKGEVNRVKYLVTYKKLKGILYSVRQRKDIPGKTGKQIWFVSYLELERWMWLTIPYVEDIWG